MRADTGHADSRSRSIDLIRTAVRSPYGTVACAVPAAGVAWRYYYVLVYNNYINFKRENREIPVAQLLSTYDRAVVHFKIVYKTSFGHITIHFYRRLRKNNFNYAVVQDYNTSILSSLETRPYYKTVLAQRRHNQSLLSATTTYSIVN